MNLTLTDEQKTLQRTARALFAKECPPSLVRELQAPDSGGMPAELWKGLADMGIFGMAFPPELNGEGASLFDLGLVYEEAGRVLCPTLVYSTLGFGLAVLRLANRELAAKWIPRLVRGDLRASVAAWNPSDSSDVEPQLVAEWHDGTWHISGVLEFVANADVVDVILASARTSGEGQPARTLAVVLDPEQKGLTIKRHRTLARDIQCRVEINGAVSDSSSVIGVDRGTIPDEDLHWISNAVTALQCMEMVGGAQAVLDRTVEYTKERNQFNRPIASFQAAQHLVANTRIAIDGARLVAYQAAWWVGAGAVAEREVSIAKLKCNEAYKGATLTAHQLHGGMGYLREMDLHLWSERAKATELMGGAWGTQIRRLERALRFAP